MSVERVSTSVSFSKQEKGLADKRSEDLGFKNRSEYIRSLIFADEKGFTHNDFVIENRESRIQDLENLVEEWKEYKDQNEEHIESIKKDMHKLQSERDRAVEESQGLTNEVDRLENIVSVRDDELSGYKNELVSVKEYRDELIKLNESLGKSFEANKIVLSDTKVKLIACESALESERLSVKEWTAKSNSQSVDIDATKLALERHEAKFSEIQLKCSEFKGKVEVANKSLLDLDHKNDVIRELNDEIKTHKDTIFVCKKRASDIEILSKINQYFINKPTFRNVLQIIKNWIKPKPIDIP